MEIDAGRRAEIVNKIKLQEEAEGAEALAQFEAMSEEKSGWVRPSRNFGSADSKVQAAVIGGHVWGVTSVYVEAEVEEVRRRRAYIFCTAYSRNQNLTIIRAGRSILVGLKKPRQLKDQQ